MRRFLARNDKELAKGPARPATAPEVDRALDCTDACASGATSLRLLTGYLVTDQVLNGPRTGAAGDGGDVHRRRFRIADDPTVGP